MAIALPHTCEHRVNYSETDKMGVVYYANYLVWFEIGRGELLRAMGLPYIGLENNGIFFPAVHVEINYHKPARYDDLLQIKTNVTETRKSRITFSYEIIRKSTGELLAEGSVVLACLNADGRPQRLPEALANLGAKK